MQKSPVLTYAVCFGSISWETYLVALAVAIPGKWIECSQLHPLPAELLRGVQCTATYVKTHLEGHRLLVSTPLFALHLEPPY